MVGFRQRPLARAKCVSKDEKKEMNGRKGRKGLGRREDRKSEKVTKSQKAINQRRSIQAPTMIGADKKQRKMKINAKQSPAAEISALKLLRDAILQPLHLYEVVQQTHRQLEIGALGRWSTEGWAVGTRGGIKGARLR